MYYMFSGPDFSTPTPSTEGDHLRAERAGAGRRGARPVGAVAGKRRAARSTGVERATGTVLAFSFFITKNMKTELRDGQGRGVLPVLYAFLARSGKTLREVTPVTLDADGGFVAAGAKPGRGATPASRSVRRHRRRGADAVLFQPPIFPIPASRPAAS